MSRPEPPQNLATSTRYAFAYSPPKYNPLPRQPLWPRLRNLTAFKALDLQLNDYRHINMPPNPPLRASTRGCFRSVLYHFSWMFFHLLCLDLSTYPAFRLAPNTFGSAFHVGGDFSQWCTDLAASSGIPRPFVWDFWMLILAMNTYQGMACIWHVVALVGVGSGAYLDEEWPKMMDKPWLSTSLNELWGRRYHQTLRVDSPYLTWYIAEFV
jgi:hypothetical protein